MTMKLNLSTLGTLIPLFYFVFFLSHIQSDRIVSENRDGSAACEVDKAVVGRTVLYLIFILVSRNLIFIHRYRWIIKKR